MLSVIVGGSRGLGQVCAAQLLERGDHVVTLARTAPTRLDAHERLRAMTLDLSAPLDATALQEALRPHGLISHLIFCQRYRGSDDRFTAELNFSLTVTKNLVEACLPLFAPRGDRSLLLVSSIAAQAVHFRADLGYHVAKAGMNSMARYYARSLGPQRIRANTIMPFTVLRPETEEFYESQPARLAAYAHCTPLGRVGKAQDAANLIEFLCSEKASFITGQSIAVDGGLSIVYPGTELEAF